MSNLTSEESAILDKMDADFASNKKASAYLKLKDGQEAVCEFSIDKSRSGPNEKFDGAPMHGYYVVKNLTEDPSGDLEQTFETSKTTGTRINAYLREGYKNLKIKRVGSGKEDTEYIVMPAPGR